MGFMKRVTDRVRGNIEAAYWGEVHRLHQIQGRPHDVSALMKVHNLAFRRARDDVFGRRSMNARELLGDQHNELEKRLLGDVGAQYDYSVDDINAWTVNRAREEGLAWYEELLPLWKELQNATGQRREELAEDFGMHLQMGLPRPGLCPELDQLREAYIAQFVRPGAT